MTAEGRDDEGFAGIRWNPACTLKMRKRRWKKVGIGIIPQEMERTEDTTKAGAY